MEKEGWRGSCDARLGKSKTNASAFLIANNYYGNSHLTIIGTTETFTECSADNR